MKRYGGEGVVAVDDGCQRARVDAVGHEPAEVHRVEEDPNIRRAQRPRVVGGGAHGAHHIFPAGPVPGKDLGPAGAGRGRLPWV